MSRSCPQSDKSEGHVDCQTCRANSFPTAFPSAGEPTTRIECRGIVVSSPMIEGQCQRPPVQPYRGSDCNGPGADSTRLLCHLGRFKLPQAECWRGRSLLGRRRAVSCRARAVLPNHLMNAPRKPFTGTDPARPRPRQTGSSQTGHLAALRLFPFKEVQATTLSLTSRGDGK